MPLTSQSWPIGAALLQFPGDWPDGSSLTEKGPEEWRSALHEVRLEGFDHVDLTDSWVRPGDLSQGQRGDLLELAGDVGLSFSAISVTRRSVIDSNERRAKANFDYALRTVEAAAAMGVPVVCFGLHQPFLRAQRNALWFWLAAGAEDPSDSEVWDLAVRRFRDIGRYAADVGVQISLEMYEGTYLGTADSCVRLIEEVSLPNVGLNPDIGNLIRLHRPVEDWRQMLHKTLPYTNYWHVKNYLRDHDPATGAYFSAPSELATGYIDYRSAIAMALDTGFDGPFCVEHYGGDGLSVTARNRDYLRHILATKLGE